MKIVLFIPKYIMRQQIGYVSNFRFAIFCEFDKQNELVAINVNNNSTTQALSQQQHAIIMTWHLIECQYDDGTNKKQ